MREIITIAILFFSFLAVATAQERKETLYGWRIENNRNLRFVDSTKVHKEVCGGAHVTFGDINALGVGLGVSRVYTPRTDFAWKIGIQMVSDYNKDFGSMTDFLFQAGTRFGKSYGFELIGLAGAGQLSYKDISTNGANRAVYHNTTWRTVAGGEVALFTKASKEIYVRLFGRYTSYLNHKGDRSYEEAEDWKHAPTRFNLNKVSVGASATVLVGGAHQVSGDHCQLVTPYAGYEFGTNKGVVIGTDLTNTKRLSPKIMRSFGIGVSQTFGERSSFNQMYGVLGGSFLPDGSRSLIIFDFGIKAGIGEYLKTESGSTDTKTYSMKSTVQVPGVVGKAYVGVNLHRGAYCLKLGVEGGGHAAFDTNFKSKTSNYDGQTRHKLGGDGSATIGLEIAL